jgi:hypothetical protein
MSHTREQLSLRPRRTRRLRRTSLPVFLAALAVPLSLLAAPATAGSTPPFTIGPNGLAEVPGTPSDASQELGDLSGSVKELGPLNSNTTKIGVIHKDAVPTLGLTNPNGQVDLRRAWLGQGRDSDKDDWVYFAWERDANSGSGFIAYEFMQNPLPAACQFPVTSANEADNIAGCNPWANRRAGDFMILWDQQGGSRDLYLRTWSGTGSNLTLSPPGDPLDASVSAAAYSADGFRGEAALNLTDTVFGGSQQCRSFANIIPSTVTGNSDSADYKDTILQPVTPIGNCTSTTTTTPKTVSGTGSSATYANIPSTGASIGNGVLAVADSALVDIQGGTATPAGSVAFSLCKVDAPDLCTTGGTSVGSTSLTGSAYPVTVKSPTAYVTSAGRYCWRAVYDGNSTGGIGGSNDSSATECFTVNPVTPTLSTRVGGSGSLGQAITDSATLGGTATGPASPVINLTGTAGPASGGSITFKLYKVAGTDAGCGTTPVYTSSAVSVSGNGSYSTPTTNQYVVTSPGSYHWVAEYSGDLPNTSATSHNTSCNDPNETLAPDQAQPTIATQASATAVLGASISDTATISSGYFPLTGGPAVGTVTFSLYGPFAANATITSSSCVDPATGVPGNRLFTSTVDASRATGTTAGATSGTYAPSAPGKYAWVASYSGNTNNLGADGTCGDANEASIITRAPASLTTAQSLRPQDSVTVTASAGGTPSGTVTFKLFGPNNATCAANGADPVYSESSVGLSNAGTAVTSNSTFSITSASSSQYRWLVSYSGDANHLPVTGTCGAENFTLTIDNGSAVRSP